MKKNYSTVNFMNENYRDWFYRNWIGTHKIILAEIFKIIAEQNTLVLGSVGPGHQPYVLVVHLQLAEERKLAHTALGTPPTASIT